MSELGKSGGSVKSKQKSISSKENGKKGGRPRKNNEEFKTGSPSEILEYLTQNPIKQKGEFTVIVA
jgi:hypothetical protein